MFDTIHNLESGDKLPEHIDETVKQLEQEGYNADYHNIYTDSAGWLASLEIAGQQIAVIDALTGDAMIRTVDRDKMEQLRDLK